VSGVHHGHRIRLKNRFKQVGLDEFDVHNMLELLLFYALPRQDVNPLAHALVTQFGSLAGVFDAPFEELEKVEGIGESAAVLLKLMPQLARQYLISRGKPERRIIDSKTAGEYLIPYFIGERDEVVYIACLDIKGKVVCCKRIFSGSVNGAGINTRKIVETALTYNATAIIMAHNHPSGIAIPSHEDKVTTHKIQEALRAVDIRLADHIVIADDDYVSFADNGFFG
jgi:DNA repair protein RadC